VNLIEQAQMDQDLSRELKQVVKNLNSLASNAVRHGLIVRFFYENDGLLKIDISRPLNG
jgi:hypothetical protein